jgi:hypothetical protein
MERIIRGNIINHLQKEKLITCAQHGFVNKKSCTTNLLETLDVITNAIKRGNALDALFLDFEKAFDKVPHMRLIQKLVAYGINGEVVNWIGDRGLS